jgi:hypothetical protein
MIYAKNREKRKRHNHALNSRDSWQKDSQFRWLIMICLQLAVEIALLRYMTTAAA